MHHLLLNSSTTLHLHHVQAEAVVSGMQINLALNLVLREEVLVEKCLGESLR